MCLEEKTKYFYQSKDRDKPDLKAIVIGFGISGVLALMGNYTYKESQIHGFDYTTYLSAIILSGNGVKDLINYYRKPKV